MECSSVSAPAPVGFVPLVTQDSLFGRDALRQGRIADPVPVRQWLDAAKSGSFCQGALYKTDHYIRHQTGIFGAYCLEDLRCIAELVLKKRPDVSLDYDCFNYETAREIVFDPKIIFNGSAPSEHINMYWENSSRLRKYADEGKLKFNQHYMCTHNDLLQKRKVEVEKGENWSKFQRVFSQNMIFFNPYCSGKTEELIDTFFDYAETNLNPDGVVTMMWNEGREDSLKYIDIEKLAEKHNFTLIRKLDGKAFARETGFRHLKNSRSLEKAVEDCSVTQDSTANTAIVSAHKTDAIFMFKRKTAKRDIPKDNIVASVLAASISAIK